MRYLYTLLCTIATSGIVDQTQAGSVIVDPTSVEISGPSITMTNTNTLFSAVAKNLFGNVISNPTYLGYGWYSPTGTVVTQTVSAATMRWASAGVHTLYFEMDTYNNVLVDEIEVTAVLPVPAVPGTLPATNVTLSSFTARWNSVAEATAYELDVAEDIDFSNMVAGFGNLSVSGGTTTSVAVTGVEAGSTYYYRVRAKNSSGTSASSSHRSVTLPIIPSIPVATAATVASATWFQANWNSVAGATGYALDVSKDSEFASFITGYNGKVVSGVSSIVSGLTEKTTYYYRLRSLNASGQSGNSNVVSVNLDNNYIETITLQKPIQLENIEEVAAADRTRSTQFFDNLGRPLQTVTQGASPAGYDVVQPIAYDAYGRQTETFLPYVSTDADGWIRRDPVGRVAGNYATSEQAGFYQSAADVAHDNQPKAVTVFEPSPLNRPREIGSAGTDWQPGAYAVKKQYKLNGANEVLKFAYNHSEETVQTTPVVYYAANDLFKNVTVDEHDNEVLEYVDKKGQIVLKKVQYEGTGANKKYAETYYVYDDFGNLVVVLPPEAVSRIKSSTP